MLNYVCDRFSASCHWSGISGDISLTGNSGDSYTSHVISVWRDAPAMFIVSSVLFCLSECLALCVLSFLYKSVYVRNFINKYAFNIDLALSHNYFSFIFIVVAKRRCCHGSSGFSLSQVVLFFHVIPDRLDNDEIRGRLHKLFRLVLKSKSPNFIYSRMVITYFNQLWKGRWVICIENVRPITPWQLLVGQTSS